MPDLDQPIVEERIPIEDSGSLSDHEATYQPRRGQQPKPPAEPVEAAVEPELPAEKVAADAALEESIDPALKYKPKDKHRANSQKARAEDVPRIKELTRKLREAEEKLAAAITVTPARATVETVAPSHPLASPSAPAVPAPAGEKFTFPAYDAWEAQNPGKSWDDWTDAKLEARDVWRDAKLQQQWQSQQTEQQKAVKLQAITSQINAFRVKAPDYDQVIDAVKGEQPPELLMAALLDGDNFPELVYYLAKHPVERHEMHLITDGKPITIQHVASVRRILEARMQAGTTGAAAPADPIKRQPRPPTPVRTGPMQTGTEPPGDGASLAEHEAFYTRKRR